MNLGTRMQVKQDLGEGETHIPRPGWRRHATWMEVRSYLET